jgi:hypothetical protein
VEIILFDKDVFGTSNFLLVVEYTREVGQVGQACLTVRRSYAVC